jgi:hypothetical protein
MLTRFLKRWADGATRARVADLETELAKTVARLSVVEAERDQMAEVIARDRARIAAETATLHRTVVGGQK